MRKHITSRHTGLTKAYLTAYKTLFDTQSGLFCFRRVFFYATGKAVA